MRHVNFKDGSNRVAVFNTDPQVVDGRRTDLHHLGETLPSLDRLALPGRYSFNDPASVASCAPMGSRRMHRNASRGGVELDGRKGHGRGGGRVGGPGGCRPGPNLRRPPPMWSA